MAKTPYGDFQPRAKRLHTDATPHEACAPNGCLTLEDHLGRAANIKFSCLHANYRGTTSQCSLSWGVRQASPWYSQRVSCGSTPKRIPKTVEGPMPHFGPFDTHREALIAACPLILSQRGATAGHLEDASFGTHWRSSTEYCAWLYRTPSGQYEMSMLVENTDPIPPGGQDERTCKLPAHVSDKRYPADSLQHLYILHNHPAVPTNISHRDISAVVKLAKIHGKFIETPAGQIPVGIIAFFSNSYRASPSSCDGFFEYSWGSTEVFKWSPGERGAWRQGKAGTVTWLNDSEFRFSPER
jgi:hypothetical protein